MSLSNGFRESKLVTVRSSNSWDLTQGDACVTVFASAFQDHRRWGQLHCPAGLRLGQRGPGGYSHRSFCHQQEVSTKATHCPHPLPSFSEGAFCLLHTKLSLLISIINTAFALPTRSSLLWSPYTPAGAVGWTLVAALTAESPRKTQLTPGNQTESRPLGAF